MSSARPGQRGEEDRVKLDLRYRPDGRAYKTCLSVFLCLLTGALLCWDSLFYAAIAAMICTQQTHEKTVNMGRHRLVGTGLGGAAGYGVLALLLCVPPGAAAWAQVVGNPAGLPGADRAVQRSGPPGLGIDLLHRIFEHRDAHRP